MFNLQIYKKNRMGHKTAVQTLIFSFLLLVCGCTYAAQAQEKPKSPEEMEEEIINMCEEKADNMAQELDLEDWQVFYVDSIMKHDYLEMQREMQTLSRQRVSNTEIYQRVQDKWMDCIDMAFRKVFDDSQWDKYLRSGAGKAAKMRQKRAQKAQDALLKQK